MGRPWAAVTLSDLNNMTKFITSISATFSWLFFASASKVMAAAAPPPQDRGLSGAPGVDITVQGLVAILFSLACYATKVIMVIVVIMLIWYGLRMMVSQDNTGAFDKAKKSLNHAIIGLLVIMATNTIIATVGNTVVAVGEQNLSTRSKSFVNYTPLSSCSF